jgi:hypothetical protein
VQQGGFRIVDFFPVQSEYKVNPHICNKQALDMDLVLICRKRSQPFQPLAHTPADALQRAQQVASGDYGVRKRSFCLTLKLVLQHSKEVGTLSPPSPTQWERGRG